MDGPFGTEISQGKAVRVEECVVCGSDVRLLSAVRYDFPILLAPPGASGADRLEIVAHIVGELFNPGDYYESGKPPFFFRWQVEFKF